MCRKDYDMLSRLALLTALAVSVSGCGKRDVSPTVPVETPPKAVANDTGPAELANTIRPAVKLAPTHVWCQGALVLRAYDRQHGIVAYVPVPRKLLKALQVPVSGKLKQGKASVSYYRGKRIDNLLAPSGAPIPPNGVGGAEYEKQEALSGSVTVTPLPGNADRQKVEVTFKDLVFKGFHIKKIGPMKAQLGLTPPP